MESEVSFQFLILKSSKHKIKQTPRIFAGVLAAKWAEEIQPRLCSERGDLPARRSSGGATAAPRLYPTPSSQMSVSVSRENLLPRCVSAVTGLQHRLVVRGGNWWIPLRAILLLAIPNVGPLQMKVPKWMLALSDCKVQTIRFELQRKKELRVAVDGPQPLWQVDGSNPNFVLSRFLNQCKKRSIDVDHVMQLLYLQWGRRWRGSDGFWGTLNNSWH